MGRVLQVEWLKLKRNKLLLMIFGAPGLFLALQFINFKLRYSMLIKPGASPWWELIQEVGSFWGALILPVMAAIIAGMVCAVEHTSNAWKYVLTMPLQRSTVYLGKLTLTFGLLILSCLLLTVGLVAVGMLLGFEESIPWEKVGWLFVYPLLGLVAITTIQVWLSTRFHNFSIPLGVGVVGVVSAMFLTESAYTRWFPWVYPFLTAPIGDPYAPGFFSLVSVGVGIVCTLAGLIEFSRRDV